MDVTHTIAAEVRAELARQRRTQADVARLLGIRQQNISPKYNGDRPWRVEELITLADWLGVPAAQFLEVAS